MRKFLYSAYVLTPESKLRLEKLLTDLDVQMLPNVHLHHCTIEYGRDTVVPNSDIGTYVVLLADSLHYDDKGVCFTVEADAYPIDRPYITVCTAHGVPPVYSKKLLREVSHNMIWFTPVAVVAEVQKVYGTQTLWQYIKSLFKFK